VVTIHPSISGYPSVPKPAASYGSIVVARAVRWAKQKYDLSRAALRALDPENRRRRREVSWHRAVSEDLFARIGRDSKNRFGGTVLVDGAFDNPNYWLRHTLLRAALGLTHAHEICLVSRHRRSNVRKTSERLGFAGCDDFDKTPSRKARDIAAALVNATRAPGDIMRWTLPFDMPAGFIYDGLLKRQRSAVVDIAHPLFLDHVVEAIAAIENADDLLTRHQPALVILSHAVDFRYGALAWLAAGRSIPTLINCGLYGTSRFWKITTPGDVFDSMDRPVGDEIDALTASKADALAEIGERCLSLRMSGITADLGALFAYVHKSKRVDRSEICSRFGWDKDKPIMVVYAPNWFDYPHCFAMEHFRDFLEWLQVTLTKAQATTSVNWLFKAHPIDDWYGGLTLKHLMPTGLATNVGLVPDDWNGVAIAHSVDALITYRGTAAIEYASLGKPVLVSDHAWYGDAGFAVIPKSRDEYIDALGRRWWDDVDIQKARKRALIFAGWYFGIPEWQRGFEVGDDPEQDALYPKYPALFERNAAAVTQEIEEIAGWFKSPHRFYHTWKMGRTERWFAR
jgi:hypothetical protein